ncbi:MAG: CoA transferase [Chloroflexi bacterium]|nr:CoA transferase [Chloroflexota bacterium]
MGAEVVVQLGQGLAAAQTALLLGRFGARVVRVSGQGGAPDHWDRSEALREAYAYGALAVDAGGELDAAALRALLERVDVVVDDRPLSYWSERGVDLRALYEGEDPPRAIWCGITPYGLAGIGAGWEGTELTEQASGPMLLRIGEPGRPPLPMKGPQAEVGAGWHAAAAVAGLRFSCERGSPGTLLDVSIQECLYMHSELGAVNWFYNGLEISHWLNAKPTAAASGYPTRDGRTVHMLFHDREWPRVARMIGRPDLERDDRFMARYNRMQHMEEMDALLIPWFLERTAMEAVEAAQESGMPMSVVRSPGEVLDDPQLRARGNFEQIEVGGARVDFPVGTGRLSGHDELPARRGETPATRPLAELLRELPPRAPSGRAGRGGGDPRLPLAGVRVLDLTNTWAAPKGATMLGDLGAEVIKLEGLEWMDMLRGFTDPPRPHPSYPRHDPGERPWDRYVMWLGLARNKLSAGVELTRPEGQHLLEELVARCDVVVTNMSQGTRERQNISFERLRALNPSVVFATLSGYGEDGPRGGWRLFGDGQAAFAGLFVGTGYEGEGSAPLGAYGDPVNGIAFAYHVVQGLRARERTGEAVHVDVSCVETCTTYSVETLLESQLGIATEAGVGFDVRGVPGRWPHAVYRCSGENAWVAVSCGSDAQREALVAGLEALGAEGADAGDPDALDALLAGLCSEREPSTLEQQLRPRGVPCQRVVRARDIDSDPVLAARGFLAWLYRDDLGTYPVYSAPWLINGRRPPITHPPAEMGEDNRYVFAELLGKGEADLAELERAGAIGDRPLVGAELGFRPTRS